MESAVNGMWTLLRTFCTNKSTLLVFILQSAINLKYGNYDPLQVPSMDNVNGLLQMARVNTSEYENLRASAIGMLGVIAQLPQFKPALLVRGYS